MSSELADRTRATFNTVASSEDPTATKTIRNRWSADMYQRFRGLKGVIREALIERDVLGLDDDAASPTVVQPGETLPGRPDVNTDGGVTIETAADYGRALAANQPLGPGGFEAPEPGAFNFPTDEAKVDGFMGWLREQERRGILEVAEFDGREVVASSEWQRTYVRNAYSRGVEKAQDALEAGDISIPQGQGDIPSVLNLPQHADAIGLAYTRSFEELRGVTDAMSQDISRTMATGLSQGWNARKTAREMNDRVDAVGLHRARLIARTETVRAANQAALNRYEDFDRRITGVTAAVEWRTAGDLRVCPECASLDATVFDIQDARGMIPLHPNCRCFWLPAFGERSGTTAPPRAERKEILDALPHAPPKQSTDVPRFLDAKKYERLVDRVNDATDPADAGFTLNSNLTEWNGDSGYVVALTSRNLSKSAGQKLTRESVVDFYTEHQPILQRYPGAKVGTFNDLDGDIISIDLNAVLHSREEAIRLGKEFNQIGIWDMENFDLIPTGGTGSPVFESFTDIIRALEDIDTWHPPSFNTPGLSSVLPDPLSPEPSGRGSPPLARDYDPRGEDADGLRQLGGIVDDENLHDGFFPVRMNTAGGSPDFWDYWEEPEVPIAFAPVDYGYQSVTVRASLNDFVDLQYYIAGTNNPDLSADAFWSVVDFDTVKGMVESVRAGERLPMPWVEVGPNGLLTATQEGRHRAMAAWLIQGENNVDPADRDIIFRLLRNPDRPELPQAGADRDLAFWSVAREFEDRMFPTALPPAGGLSATGDDFVDRYMDEFQKSASAPPDDLNPFIDVDDVSPIGGSATQAKGVNSANMRVVTKSDGTKLLVKNYENSYLGDTAEGGDIASRFMRRVDPDIAPETYRPSPSGGSDTLVVKFVDGTQLEDVMWGPGDLSERFKADDENILDVFASGLITRNRDQHFQNVFYDADKRKLVGIDNDLSFFHIADETDRRSESTQFWSRWRRFKNEFDVNIDDIELMEHAVEIARDTDTVALRAELESVGYEQFIIDQLIERIEEAARGDFTDLEPSSI